MTRPYVAPTVTRLGSLHELTLDGITKTAGTGDTIHIGAQTISVPGHSVTSISH
jgi:hypothetical protein